MNDFDTLLGKVLEQTRALKIPISKQIEPHVAVNSRAISRFGCCIRSGSGYRIELSDRLYTAAEQVCLQILAHEVLHTCPGCRNHGDRWKQYADQMNTNYGYEICRTVTCAELGVPDIAPVRHLIICTSCGAQFRRAKASRLVQHPERYRCRCGGKLERSY